jgi:hypothetical protein
MSFTDQRYAPINVVELALAQLIQDSCGPDITVYEGDEDTAKNEEEYLVVFCENIVESITPGSGIFEADMVIRYVSKTKVTQSDERDSVIKEVTDVIYDAPGIVSRLSTKQNFYCYGFVDQGGERTFDPDKKETIFSWNWEIIFMPRDNA